MFVIADAAVDAVKWTDVGIYHATWTLAAVTAVLVAVTGALAVFTGRLFGATKLVATQTGQLADKTKDLADKTAELATDTVRATERADVHHRQSLAPMLIVKPGFRWMDRLILFKVQNIGPGPATLCKVVVTEYGGEDISNAYKLIPPLGTLEEAIDEIECPLINSARPNGQSHKELNFDLHATDVFGQTVITKWKGTGIEDYPFSMSRFSVELTDVVLPEA